MIKKIKAYVDQQIELADSIFTKSPRALGGRYLPIDWRPRSLCEETEYEIVIDAGLAALLESGCGHLASLLGPLVVGFRQNLNLPPTDKENLNSIRGALIAIKFAIDQGLLTNVERLVAAPIFEDLLSQADHLQKQGYSIAAGSIARAVLERHLRNWCAIVGISIQKAHPTISDYNVELYKANKYGQHPMQQVTAMVVIANDAAHARLEEKDFGQIDTLLRDVREFVTKYFP